MLDIDFESQKIVTEFVSEELNMKTMLHHHLVFHVQKKIMKCKVLCFIVRH